MSIREQVEAVIDGDLVAVLPLIDDLKDRDDFRWFTLNMVVGELFCSVERIASWPVERPSDVEFAASMRGKAADNFGESVRELFWLELRDHEPDRGLRQLALDLGVGFTPECGDGDGPRAA